MRFSPVLISNLIIWPLRYFFSHYAGEDLKYDSDEKKAKIDIGVINNFHTIPLQQIPRILVNRGDYSIDKVGLTDNLAQGKSPLETRGKKDVINMVMVSGTAIITIEARQEGTVELITDMVTHFLVWSRPHICDTQGFKNFAMPLNVSSARVDKEDKEKFQTIVMIPYSMEEQWNVKDDALKLNEFYLTLTRS